jgi:hypothetical protein
MAVPVTPRNSPQFSSEGIIAAAVLGLTDTNYNTSTALQFIPNMDGFPNGRRLEDDVTRIELQAVGGAALAAIGLWYDDWTIGQSPLTPNLLGVLGYTTGVETNDTTFKSVFPYVQTPWSGYGLCSCGSVFTALDPGVGLNIGRPQLMMETFPNPASVQSTVRIRLTSKAKVNLSIYNSKSQIVDVLIDNEVKEIGMHEIQLNLKKYSAGTYYLILSNNGQNTQSTKLIVVK